jgi:hypothetical protein
MGDAEVAGVYGFPAVLFFKFGRAVDPPSPATPKAFASGRRAGVNGMYRSASDWPGRWWIHQPNPFDPPPQCYSESVRERAAGRLLNPFGCAPATAGRQGRLPRAPAAT